MTARCADCSRFVAKGEERCARCRSYPGAEPIEREPDHPPHGTFDGEGVWLNPGSYEVELEGDTITAFAPRDAANDVARGKHRKDRPRRRWWNRNRP